MPFSIHQYLRQARHRHDDPLFPVYGNAKRYARMPQIQLGAPARSDFSLADALLKRQSFPTDGSLNLTDLTVADVSNLFGLALKAHEGGTRPHPSGGGLYPIETYFIGTLDGNESAHVYHYDPFAHTLADLWVMPADRGMQDILLPSVPYTAPACIVFTGMWARNGIKYGDFSYYLGMLEAGHAAQNILLAATSLDISSRPIGGFDDDVVSSLLDIDQNLEQVLYLIMIGK